MYVLFVSAFALGYGQSIQELQNLKAEYEKFLKGQKQLQFPTGVDGGVDPTTGLPRQAQITPYQPTEIDEDNHLCLTPSLITIRTYPKALMSKSGFPSTTIMSASFPGSIVPSSSETGQTLCSTSVQSVIPTAKTVIRTSPSIVPTPPSVISILRGKRGIS